MAKPESATAVDFAMMKFCPVQRVRTRRGPLPVDSEQIDVLRGEGIQLRFAPGLRRQDENNL